jgi:hypothetical protein
MANQRTIAGLFLIVSPCAEELLSGDVGVSENRPLNKIGFASKQSQDENRETLRSITA